MPHRLTYRALLSSACLLLAAACAHSQTTPATPSLAPQLSPLAAYDQATRPLDIVRRSVGNWSDPEIAALSVGMKQAALACSASTPEQFAGADLLAFARLCAYGQMWEPVQQSATYYLAAQSAATPTEKLTDFPDLATAYDYEIQASLHLKDIENAIQNAHAMLAAVPYDELTSEATSLTSRYIQLTQTNDALAILTQRQPILLALIKAHPPLAAASLSPASPAVASLPSTHPQLPLYSLYADAIALPAMQQFAAQPQAAAASFADLEAALPPTLSPDDAIFTAQSRRQYQLLGAPLPAFAILENGHPERSEGPAFSLKPGDATVLFLFPDWCAQCVAMGPQFTAIAARLALNRIHFYALLAQAAAPDKPAPKPSLKASPVKPVPHVDVQLIPKTAAESLAGTPTLVVPTETLATFAATDFPLIVIADHRGIIRSIELSPDNGLAPDGFLEQLVYHVIDHWPPTPR